MKDRYPGVQSFRKEDKELFFGRGRDIERLYKLIELEKQVLVYSKSGLGKTSLINAGIIPKLQKNKNYLPVFIRFTSFTEGQESPLQITEQILKQFDNNIRESLVEQVFKHTQTLWVQLKKLQINHNESKVYIIFFDQFEELFSYPEEQIIAFKNSVAELLNTDIPPQYRNLIGQKRTESRTLFNRESITLLLKSLPIKIVFVIRSDKLNLLNKLTDRIPNIQQVFYELEALDLNQAKDAILKPAQQQGQYTSPAFTYTSEALSQILNFLTNNSDQAVEGTQLQIICNRCEKLIIDKAIAGKDLFEIQVSDITSFEDVFLDFYRQTINKLPPEEQCKAELFIENELIRKERRVSLDGIVCQDYISQNSLQILVKEHLLSVERNTTNGVNYELSHDSLILPILNVKARRLEQEQQIRLQDEKRKREKELAEVRKKEKDAQDRAEKEQMLRKQAEHNEKLANQRKKFALIVCLIAILSSVAAIWNWRKANDSKALAEINLEKAIRASDSTKKALLQVKSYIDSLELLTISKIQLTEKLEAYKFPLSLKKGERDNLFLNRSISFNKSNYSGPVIILGSFVFLESSLYYFQLFKKTLRREGFDQDLNLFYSNTFYFVIAVKLSTIEEARSFETLIHRIIPSAYIRTDASFLIYTIGSNVNL
jgi:hypothetical protein